MSETRLNRRFTLAARPQGTPTARDFHFETQPVPEPADGQVLLRTRYLSLDPYMRGMMDEAGPGYAPAVQLGQTMVGGTVSVVEASRHPRFSVGQLVLSNSGWQDYALSDGADLTPLGEMAQPSLALGGLGMPGFTAYVGLLDIGEPKPGENSALHFSSARRRRSSGTGMPYQPQFSSGTSSITTNVESSGLPSTSSSSWLTPRISAAFSSAVAASRPGPEPSRVICMLTMGIALLLS